HSLEGGIIPLMPISAWGVHPVDALYRELHMIAENIRHTLCYHRCGSGRSGFASRRRLDRSSVPLRLVLPELVMNPRSEPQKSFPRPQIARLSLASNGRAAHSARIVGLRQSLVRFTLQAETPYMRQPVRSAPINAVSTRVAFSSFASPRFAWMR